jgi:uncharacterized protein
MAKEIHTWDGGIECRSGSREIVGLAFAFNSQSRMLPPGFFERIAPSFADRAKGSAYQGIISRYAHKDEFLLGRTDAGTLKISQDARGLSYAVDVPPYHDFVYESVQRGDLRSSSFAFDNAEDDWDFTADVPVRTLHSADIWEVGPCPIGAYQDATVGLRSFAVAVDVPYEDVKQYADTGNLAALYKRSDNRGPAKVNVTRTGAEALADTMAAQRLSGRQAYLETLRVQYPPTPKTLAEVEDEEARAAHHARLAMT